MNEYFDSRIGGDRVFESAERRSVGWHLPFGLTGFVLAFAVAMYLTYLRGWPVLGFALFGGLAALSYLVPPVCLSYRGLGETVISVSYGPALTLGGFCLQTGYLSVKCFLASLLPALFIFALALANEVPDFYGDRIVGKKNLIVRMGRRGGAHLYGITMLLCLAAMIAGALGGLLPSLLGLLALLLVPVVLLLWRRAVRDCEMPLRFAGVIRGTILLYVLTNVIAIFSYSVH